MFCCAVLCCVEGIIFFEGRGRIYTLKSAEFRVRCRLRKYVRRRVSFGEEVAKGCLKENSNVGGKFCLCSFMY